MVWCRPVEQYTLEGELVAVYPSAEAAIRHLQRPSGQKSNISRNCRGRIPSAYGYVWRFVDPPDEPGETWKTHPTLGVRVSCFGRVELRHGNKTYGSANGSCTDKRKVSIDGVTHTVHRLVAETYHPNPENKPKVLHLDGNGRNNCVWNLRWATEVEVRDAWWERRQQRWQLERELRCSFY